MSSNKLLFYIMSLVAICISFIFGTISGMKQADNTMLVSMPLSLQKSYKSKCYNSHTHDHNMKKEVGGDQSWFDSLVDMEKDEINKEIDRRVQQ